MKPVVTKEKVLDEIKEGLRFSQSSGGRYTWVQSNNEVLQEVNMLNLRNSYHTHSFIVLR